MHTLSLYRKPTQAFLEQAIKEKGWSAEKIFSQDFPQEDAWAASEQYPIYAVADGVTLEPGPGGYYPTPSGAGAIADIFCQTIVKGGERRFKTLAESDLEEIFAAANKAAGSYNRKHGRSKETSNFRDFDLFAATGAFAVKKDNCIFWASICDSYVVLLDSNGAIAERSSQECSSRMRHHLPKHWKELSREEKTVLVRSVYRNGVNEKGEPIGYGVLTGEPEAHLYLNAGVWTTKPSQTLLLLTDGFEHHLDEAHFRQMLASWPENLEHKLDELDRTLAGADPHQFGHERTLLAITLSR